MSIGGELAHARREAGLSVTDVSQRTRIREPIVRAIEADDFSGCGGDFYARGFIRAIARAAGTDPAPLVREYDAAHPPVPSAAGADLPRPAGTVLPAARRRPGLIVAVALVVAAVAGLACYQLLAGSGPAPRATSEVGSGVVSGRHHAVSPPAPAPSPAVRRLVIGLTAAQDCWVEFRTPGGRFVSQSYVPAGRSRRWTFSRAIDMTLGNPGGVTLTVNGRRPLPAGTAHPVTLRLRPSARRG